MSHDVGYEKSDVNVKKIVIPSVVFGAVIVFFIIGLDHFFLLSKEKMYFEQVLQPESMELKEMRQKEADVLSNYKMLDNEKGMVQIPIQRAMELEVLEHSK